MPSARVAPGNGALRGVLRIVVLYALFASLWIFGSDWLLARLVPDSAAMARLGLLKGWGFVAVSALLLYGAMRRLVDEAGLKVVDTFPLIGDSFHTILKCKKA